MADTYNENEIVKLKHLTEFARQLTNNLGDILPERVFRNIQYNVTNTNTYTDAPADGVINLTTADCIKNGNFYRFQLRFSGSLALCFPQVTATSSIGMTLKGHTATYYYKGGLGGSDIWNIMFTTNSDAEYVIQPQVITFKVTFPAYGGYASWTKTFIFNITAA